MIWQRYSPDNKPPLDGSPVLLAVWCNADDVGSGLWVKGEAAYVDYEGDYSGWWWANTTGADYERLEDTYGEPNPATWRWLPFPEAPEKPPLEA